MTNLKYEITSESKVIEKTTLFRIRALRDFGNVKSGDLGGWIEKESNLSHERNSWVSENAQVYGNSWVSGNAQVYGNAKVYDNALVFGDAKVSGNAQVCRNALVAGYSWVSGNDIVSGNALVF
jgi:NDP-sugar pyrophosphorylase family protein